MRTPAGRECPYFYGDYFRGREIEECRLLSRTETDRHWTPDLCSNCPVPDITLANACEHLVLDAKIRSSLLGLRRRVEVQARCNKCVCVVEDPYVGCGECHSNIQFLLGE